MVLSFLHLAFARAAMQVSTPTLHMFCCSPRARQAAPGACPTQATALLTAQLGCASSTAKMPDATAKEVC